MFVTFLAPLKIDVTLANSANTNEMLHNASGSSLVATVPV